MCGKTRVNVAALKHQLCDLDYEVRRAARDKLAASGDSRWQKAFNAERDEDRDDLLLSAIDGDKEVTEILQVMLRSPDEGLRLFALECFGRLGDGQYTRAILDLLSDASETVPLKAMWALGELGNTAAAPSLMTLISRHGMKPYFRWRAFAAISRLPLTVSDLKNRDWEVLRHMWHEWASSHERLELRAAENQRVGWERTLQRMRNESPFMNDRGLVMPLTPDEEAIACVFVQPSKKFLESMIQSVVDGSRILSVQKQPEETVMIYDLRSDEEKRIIKAAQAGNSLGKKADDLCEELLAISRNRPFISLSEGGGPALLDARVQEIGRELAGSGGMSLMQAVYYRFELAGGNTSHLSVAWHGIGGWLN